MRINFRSKPEDDEKNKKQKKTEKVCEIAPKQPKTKKQRTTFVIHTHQLTTHSHSAAAHAHTASYAHAAATAAASTAAAATASYSQILKTWSNTAKPTCCDGAREIQFNITLIGSELAGFEKAFYLGRSLPGNCV